jgi:hypothetical protein
MPPQRRAITKAYVTHRTAARRLSAAKRQLRVLDRTLTRTQLLHRQGARSAARAIGGPRGARRSARMMRFR